MNIDLHIHTDISDGFKSIEQSLQIAKAKNITGVAITDHDTTEGLMPAIILGAKLGIEVIAGVEISAIDKTSGVKAHILGYFFNLPANNINRLCAPILKARHELSLWQMQKLVQHGYNIDIDQVIAKRQGRPVYKQHIMLELIDKGYTDAIYSKLYIQLFKGNGICAAEIEYVDVNDAIRAIKADGGIAVLAHPGYDKNYFLLEQAVQCGLDGIELFHEKHSLQDLKQIVKLAKQHNLILTGGSDYHGESHNKFFGKLLCPKKHTDFFVTNNTKPEVFLPTLAIKAAKHLKGLISQNQNILHYKEERCDNLVTDIDIKLEQFLISSIKEKFPTHGFISEENTVTRTMSEYTWIIDPLDGTTNFVSCKKNYAISIALYKNMQPYAGIVYDVCKDELYFAISGRGAWLNGKPLTTATHKAEHLKDAVLDFSLNTIIDLQKCCKNLLQLSGQIRGHRAYGCASLSICKVATGELSAYISSKLCIWDYAAAVIVLQELGGVLLCCADNNVPYKAGLFIAASNDNLLQELLTVVSGN